MATRSETVEPAAVLIGTFEINIGRPFITVENGKIGRAGIEPDVENVIFLAPF